MTLRNAFYQWGVLRSTSYDFPLIGVGNLRVGGTGKTPMVEYLVRLLRADHNMAMLSRGYGRKTEGYRMVELGDSAQQVGDEPAQVKQKFPGLSMAVDGNRVRGISKLKAGYPELNLLVLDDVFQHRSVKPGLMIMLTAYHQLYLDDHVLPMGRLREPKSSVWRADIIVVTKCPRNLTPVEKRGIHDRIRPKAYQQVFFTTESYCDLKTLDGKETEGSVGRDTSVLLVTGIASAKSVEDYVDKNFRLEKHIEFGDHHTFTQKDMQDVVQAFESIQSEKKIILTTEKDAQRLQTHLENEKFASLPVHVLPMEIKFSGDEQEAFNNMIHDYIRSYSTVGPVHS